MGNTMIGDAQPLNPPVAKSRVLEILQVCPLPVQPHRRVTSREPRGHGDDGRPSPPVARRQRIEPSRLGQVISTRQAAAPPL